MFLEWSSSKHTFFVITSFDWLPWQPIGKICEKYLKINSSEAVWGIKLKLCSIVSNIILYKMFVFYLPLLMHFGCCGNLKFPLTYNGKSENWDLLLYHCRNFDTFYRNVPWVVLYQTYKFCLNHWTWLVAMATEKINLRKILKNNLIRSHKGDEAETLQKCS